MGSPRLSQIDAAPEHPGNVTRFRSFMTATPDTDNSSPSPVQIDGGLIDALIEAVVLPPDGRSRAAVIFGVVQEMCAAVEWLHDPEDGVCEGSTPADCAHGNREDDELLGLGQVAAAAREHCQRMAIAS